MRLVVSPEASSYIASHGGALWVAANHHRCCSGSMTLLDATTDRPADESHYQLVGTSPVPVLFKVGGTARPEELVVQMRGVRRKRPAAYWDGCAFRP